MVISGPRKQKATFGVRIAGFVTLFDWLVVRQQSCAPGILCSVRSYHPPPGWGLHFCRRTQRHCYAYFFEQELGPCLKAITIRLFLLFLYPLPSLISNCLNPPFGTQGRSRMLNEAYILQTRNGEHITDLYSRAPQNPAQFLCRELGNYDCDNFLSKQGIGLSQLGEETLNWKYS